MAVTTAPPTGRTPPLRVGWIHRVVRDKMLLAAVTVTTLAGLANGINMLHYPYLEDDEGSYVGYAWAVIHEGRLGPYHTYFYEHPPFGWIFIAFWEVLTGGTHAFGYAIASGRVLMLVLHVASCLLLLSIGRRVSGRTWVGLLAALGFALAPYGLDMERRVLLDNLAAFWLLVSIWLLVGPRVTLRRVLLSAVACAFAILSKEIAVAALPGLAILAARALNRERRAFATAGWLAVAFGVSSLYVLMALLKGEFFPAGTRLGGSHPHLSLLCTLQWQAQRGRDGGLLSFSSGFWNDARDWAYKEPLLVVGGTLAVVIAILLSRTQPAASGVGIACIGMYVVLGRGGIVLPFYIVPLLPLLALELALVVDVITKALTRAVRLRPRQHIAAVAACVAVVGLVPAGLAVDYSRADLALWSARPADGQVQAIDWVMHNIPADSRIIIDQYIWVDLHDPGHGHAAFPNAQYYWKVGTDPEVSRTFFHNDWRSVDYVITTPQLLSDTEMEGWPLVRTALDHSVSVKAFDSGGWRVDVRKVEPQSNRPSDYHWAKAQPASLPSCMTYGM